MHRIAVFIPSTADVLGKREPVSKEYFCEFIPVFHHLVVVDFHHLVAVTT